MTSKQRWIVKNTLVRFCMANCVLSVLNKENDDDDDDDQQQNKLR